MASKKERLYALDTLKGILIFAIVLYHMPAYMRGFPEILNVFYKYGGDVGNSFFFALSGFTLCYAYEGRNGLTLREFIKKRILSVYVIYLITDAVSLLFSIMNFGLNVLNIKELTLNLLMITSGWVEDIYPYNVPTWFFSALLLDYVLWFLIDRSAKNKKWYVFAAMIFLGLTIQKNCFEKPFLYYHTGEAIVPFFEGCILYKMWIEKREKHKDFRFEIGVLICLFVLCIALTSCVGFDTAAGSWKYVWYVIYVPLILFLVLDLKWLNHFLSSKAMVAGFGNISKYIFFWHSPLFSIVGGILLKLFSDSVNTICVVYLITLYVFCTGYRSLELMIKRYWRGSLN